MLCPICNKKSSCVAGNVSHMRGHVRNGELKESVCDGKVIFITKTGSKFLATGEPLNGTTKPVASSPAPKPPTPSSAPKSTATLKPPAPPSAPKPPTPSSAPKSPPAKEKICPVCKAKLSISSAAAIAHLRSHVRKNELTEEQNDGHLEFTMGNHKFSLSSL